jgi:hypothetical protein
VKIAQKLTLPSGQAGGDRPIDERKESRFGAATASGLPTQFHHGNSLPRSTFVSEAEEAKMSAIICTAFMQAKGV